MIELELLDEAGPRVVGRVGAKAMYVGRAPHNDVVLVDDTVSSRHLAVWSSGGRVYVEDLGSRNGTFIGDDQLTGIRAIGADDTVRVGENNAFRVKGLLARDPAAPDMVTLVEDVEAGVRMPVRCDRFVIGSDMGCDEVLPEGPAVAATLLLHDDGDLQLGVGDDTVDVAVDEPFEVEGRRYAVRRVPSDEHATRTRELVRTQYPIRLAATLDGATGPEATLHHLRTGDSHTVTAANRAVLLYLLGRQVATDEASGVPPAERGWCTDYDVVTGIWGKTDPSTHLNKLNVLICRTRTELRKAGFDPWFIEKRRGYLRLRVSRAEVE